MPTSNQSDRYQELFERSADASMLLKGNNFLDCNQAAVELFGCSSKSQVLETHPSELSPEHQPDGRTSFEKANAMIALARQHGSHRFEWTHKKLCGTAFPAEVLLTLVDDSETPLVHAVVRDLTDKWRLEEQLRQSQKMEAIGKLAGGIAHDFNNLLVAILGNCHIIKANNEDRKTLSAAHQILEASERAAALVRQLMSFSRREPRSRQRFDLEEEISSIAPLLQRTLGEHIRVELDLQSDCFVFMDSSQVDQLILNLASNARDAMTGGGVLRIGLRRVSGEDCSLDEPFYAEVTVQDSGVGMSDEVARRAFEPFFTTKGPEAGTGFGLATVYSIVDQEGGTARIESSEGLGTTIRLYLPLSDGPEHADGAFDARPDLDGSERLLYVEDDPLIGELLRDELRSRGYTVHFARNGREALAKVEALNGAAIDLIVTDVIMPEVSGPQLVQELRARGIDTPVLFVSGYTDSELAVLGDTTVELLHKPFLPDLLVERIRALLDADR